jgi:hypothetical protein
VFDYLACLPFELNLVPPARRHSMPLDLARFDYPAFFSGCGRDVMNLVFEFCPMGALARFAGTNRDARQRVQAYLRLWIYTFLESFIRSGLSIRWQWTPFFWLTGQYRKYHHLYDPAHRNKFCHCQLCGFKNHAERLWLELGTARFKCCSTS